MRILFAVWALCLLISNVVHSEDLAFRCESEVFLEGQAEPVQSSITLFQGRVIHDFQLGSSEEITVLDLQRGRITLLQPKRQQRTSLGTDDLLRVAAIYQTRKSETELFTFCTQPKFTESLLNNVLSLKGSCLSYQATCVTPEITGAELVYREFADWSARLNALRPGNLPPFARLELNQTLAKHQLLPTKLIRTIEVTSGKLPRREVVRSEHLFNWSLTGEDQRRLERAATAMGEYSFVSPETYFEWSSTTLTKNR